MTATADRLLTPAEVSRALGEAHAPTHEQSAVVSAPLEPCLVVAGAGSGKTTTMATRVVWLVATGQVRPEQVLGLTFTRKAAAELSARVRSRLAAAREAGLLPVADDAAGEPVVSTYHAFAGRLYREHALRLGLEPGARLVTPAVAWQLMARVVGAYDGPMGAVPLTPPSVVAAALQLASESAEHLVPLDEVAAVGARLRAQAEALPGRLPADVTKVLACQEAREQLVPLVAEFTRRKRAAGVVDHGDVVALAARVAREHPVVGAAERSRAAVVLLDEFQDTGHAQRVLLRSLFGRGHAVTAVGDPCQSIYGWRGASAGGLGRFPTDFPRRDGTPSPVLTLATSFRNGPQVLAVANRLATPLQQAGARVPVLVAPPSRAAEPGRVVAALLETEQDEAAWVAEQVQRALPDGRVEGPGSAAVLARKRAQFPTLRAALEARGLPVEVVGLGGLLSVPEVADVVATLQALADPTANAAVVRLLTGPRWRLGPRDLVALGRRAARLGRTRRGPGDGAGGDAAGADGSIGLDPVEAVVLAADEAEGGSLVEALDDPGPLAAYSREGAARLTALGEELRRLRAATARPLPDLVALVERTVGLDVEVAARPGTDAPGAARADLDAFLDVAAEFAGDEEEPTLAAFLAYLAAAEEQEFGLETGGRVGATASVKLLTVHAAKGLEWDVVAVPGLAAGPRAQVFPAKPKTTSDWTGNRCVLPFELRGDAADLPRLPTLAKEPLAALREQVAERELLEERRLMYVAATRARHLLLASGRWWGDGRGRLGPSAFLRELVEVPGVLRETWAEEPEEDAENPTLADAASAPWPAAPQVPTGVTEGAALVRAARSSRARAPDSHADAEPDPVPAVQEQTRVWDEEIAVLLAERDARSRPGAPVRVSLPEGLTVSTLVALRADPDALARRVRRPLPRRPDPVARRGTRFHLWLESVWGQQALLDPDELPGAADESADPADDLAALQEAFRASPWWGRTPWAVEVPFEAQIAGVAVRGRMDAVFRETAARTDGEEPVRWTVVDWKTGSRPTGSGADAAAVQLAAYRLAWADITGSPVEAVDAAFHYVRSGETVRPDALLDRAGLEALVRSVDPPPAAG